MDNKAILQVENLTVDKINQRQLVKDVSFCVKKGRILGLVGESGSGKSTICMAILGLLKKNFRVSGRAYLNNKDIIHINENEKRSMRGEDISIIMQNPMTAFNPLIKIGHHFVETLIIHKGLRKKEAYSMAITYLEKMKLPRIKEIMDSYSFQLSGGMLQRVMIAIAISMKPKLLIADEPTTSLDVKTQFQILSEIDRVKTEYDTGILFISHDFRVIAQLADDVGVMYNGEFVEYGSVAKIFDNPVHPYTKKLLISSLSYDKSLIKSSKANIKSYYEPYNSKKVYRGFKGTLSCR